MISWLVVCSVLPYGTSICCCSFIYYFEFFLIASVHSFYILFFFKSGIDYSTEWSTIPECPGLMCFFNRGNTEGTNSLKLFCLMFVCVFCTFASGLILLLFWIICSLMTCVLGKKKKEETD